MIVVQGWFNIFITFKYLPLLISVNLHDDAQYFWSFTMPYLGKQVSVFLIHYPIDWPTSTESHCSGVETSGSSADDEEC